MAPESVSKMNKIIDVRTIGQQQQHVSFFVDRIENDYMIITVACAFGQSHIDVAFIFGSEIKRISSEFLSETHAN